MKQLQAIVCLLLSVPVVRADDWPQWLGPKRDGASSEKVLPWKEMPKELWRQPAGVGYSVPVVAAGRVFVHERVPDKEEERIVAYDAKSGKEIWRDTYGRATYTSVLNTGPQATPTVAGNRVYTFGITGVLSCYHAESGKRLWQVNVYKKVSAALPQFGVTCSPVVIGNRVVVAAGGKGSSVAAFDTEKGELQWQGLDEPAGTASPVLFASGGRLPEIVFMTTLRLVALNPLDGNINWEFPLPFQPSGTAPTPMILGDQILTSTMTNGSTLVRIGMKDDKPSGEQLWQEKELSGYFSTGVGTKERLYVLTNVIKPVPNASLRCIERKTGKEIWKKGTIGYFHAGVIRTGDNKLLILSDSGHLRLAEDTGTEYRELATSKVCGGTLVNLALANGCVYIRDDKNVIAYRIAE